MRSLPIIDDTPAAGHAPGPLERALDDVWALARRRLDRPGWLRASLALRRRFNLRLLRIGELKIAIPTGQVPDCDSCVEICCTGPNAVVSLRLRDIAALMDAGLEHAIIRRHTETGAGDAAARRDGQSWARRMADDSVFHRAFPVLAHDATGTCVLLTEDRRCGAWPAWPLSCARYPYALDLQLKVVFWARGCGPRTTLPAHEAPLRVRTLVRAVVDAYNERVKDVVRLRLARDELGSLGLLRHIDLDQLPWSR